jgi:hypothetical protein
VWEISAAVREEEWAVVCRHFKAAKEEYKSTEHEIDSDMERYVINSKDSDIKGPSGISDKENTIMIVK